MADLQKQGFAKFVVGGEEYVARTTFVLDPNGNLVDPSAGGGGGTTPQTSPSSQTSPWCWTTPNTRLCSQLVQGMGRSQPPPMLIGEYLTPQV